MRDRPTLETSDARCEEPKRNNRKRFAQLHPDKFRCKGAEELRTRYADQCLVDNKCPKQCVCDGTIVDCSRQGLQSLPDDVPTFATELYVNLICRALAVPLANSIVRSGDSTTTASAEFPVRTFSRDSQTCSSCKCFSMASILDSLIFLPTFFPLAICEIMKLPKSKMAPWKAPPCYRTYYWATTNFDRSDPRCLLAFAILLHCLFSGFVWLALLLTVSFSQLFTGFSRTIK